MDAVVPQGTGGVLVFLFVFLAFSLRPNFNAQRPTPKEKQEARKAGNEYLEPSGTR
jgi:hypothetical protein